jgi:hypothetical protein
MGPTSVTDLGCLSQIQILTLPGSWIQQQQQIATNTTKLKVILFLNWQRRKSEPIYKEF